MHLAIDLVGVQAGGHSRRSGLAAVLVAGVVTHPSAPGIGARHEVPNTEGRDQPDQRRSVQRSAGLGSAGSA
jgi:hypothetical protein